MVINRTHLNFTVTGCNYYTVDIGCFFVNEKKTWNKWFAQGVFHNGADDMGYREFYTRMFQYGTFLPIQRSHGTDTPREIWNFGNSGEPFYDAILKMIHLRYQLLPYNYSLADAVSHRGYTMMRMLAFDYPDDSRVHDLKDEYMYGPALLVCPVTQPFYFGPGSTPLQVENKQRAVYLPKGDRWVDFWTDKSYDGGQQIQADATINRLPLFVRAGSIIPMGPVVQFTSESVGKDISLHIYPGKGASFTLYQDEGDSYRYEEGACSRVVLHWDNRSHTLSMSARNGQYEGMSATQTFNIILHQDHVVKKKTITYQGKAIKIKI